MRIIVLGGRHRRSRTLNLGRRRRVLLAVLVLGLPMSMGLAFGYLAAAGEASRVEGALLEQLRRHIDDQQVELEDLRSHSEHRLAAMTARMARLQAQLVRLDALGERVTDLARLDDGEFDFSQPPALGGPEIDPLPGVASLELTTALDELARRIDDREHQLTLLEQLVSNRQLDEASAIAGRPIRKGWLSSPYGRRNDPFTGRVSHHNGVDFAGAEGSEVVSVAAGVVTWAGTRSGYGKLIEISHGDGHVTRYGHNKVHLVRQGEVVEKGQVIALMGSTGRSTGPHVHFEVHVNGRAVDPARYIQRASR